jgi:Xaa-Pro aminopeptidase
MLVTDLVNVRYLTGYSGTNGLALLGPQTRKFITDFRYVQQAAEEVDPCFERIQAPQNLLEAIAGALPSARLRLGFEAEHVSIHDHRRLRELLGEGIELIEVEGLVEGLRAVKDEEEIERIRAAAELADAALQEVLEQGLVGRTERQVALALEVAMRERGAERPSFETIVACGPHGALPHAAARDKAIEPGQLVVIDWGAQLDGYCSDCTRTFATGEPGEQARETYALTLSAQLAGLEGVRAGACGREVDAGARRLIEEGGHGEHFGHGLGHGVGLEVHEAPRLAQRSKATLAAGNVVTVEPGVYLPGELGVRIEDLAVVRERGCEVLTSLSKELRIVD